MSTLEKALFFSLIVVVVLATVFVLYLVKMGDRLTYRIIELETKTYVPVQHTRFALNEWYDGQTEEVKLEVQYALTQYVGDLDVVQVILRKSLEHNIPFSIAFAIAWTESRFFVEAINHNSNDTFDYGLFQINSAYAPYDTVEEFFLLENNANYALALLRENFERNNYNWVLAIAAYNAGMNGIRDGVSYHTLLHVNSVLKQEEFVNSLLAPFLEDSNKE